MMPSSITLGLAGDFEINSLREGGNGEGKARRTIGREDPERK
jgi:hypothetical protein